MNSDFPRLLVATEFPPNASGGGPAVVRQMLKDWPPDRLHWWSALPEASALFGREVASHHAAIIPSRLYPRVRLAKAKSLILETAWVPWATGHLKRTIARVTPEVIWAIPHQWAIPALARSLPSGPIGYHLTVQDYPDGRRHAAALGLARCERRMSSIERLYSAAATRDATSHPMIEDLSRRSGRDAAQMLHAGLEADDFGFLEAPGHPAQAVLRIAYAGTIVSADAFIVFASALRQVRKNMTLAVELHFFGAHSYRAQAWFEPGWMFEHGDLGERELARALQSCTWGFSPMDLADGDPQYNRYSFPTKFITYLAAGLPIITLGHPESSVMKMARAYGVGVSSSAATPEELIPTLRTALQIPAPRGRYAKEIIRCAKAEFDAARTRAVLRGCFDQCRQATHNCSAASFNIG